MVKPSVISSAREVKLKLKLALPCIDTAALLGAVTAVPVLQGLASKTMRLHDTYYDTPTHQMRQNRMALCVRRKGNPASPIKLQTLVSETASDAALSQCIEWTCPVNGAQLDWNALAQTPSSDMDPEGHLTSGLLPSFVTVVGRRVWSVLGEQGCVVEVALDIGTIQAGNKSAAIAELELELKDGLPQDLFALARKISPYLAVLPASVSRAERGYALSATQHISALTARPPDLNIAQEIHVTGRRIMREMFSQFTGNLCLLPASPEAELVHQARIGWRRFSSAAKLFKSVPGLGRRPDCTLLQPLCKALSALRDLDVARMEVLPQYAQSFVSGNAVRAQTWKTMVQTLDEAAGAQRQAVLDVLKDPRIGGVLLDIAEWLEVGTEFSSDREGERYSDIPFKQWARRKVVRLHGKLELARTTVRKENSAAQWHSVRLLAKRVRYGMEAVHSVLPKKRTQQWHQQALRLQTKLGNQRDTLSAIKLLEELGVDETLVSYLRGIAAK